MQTYYLTLGTGTFKFSINTSNPSTGAGITVGGTPALVGRKNGGALFSLNGLTLSVDHNDGGGAVTGEHQVAIDVDDGTDAFADGDFVELFWDDATTVNSVSVEGKKVAEIHLQAAGLTTQEKTDVTAAVPTAVAIRTEMDSNSTQLAAIVADTNELQTDDYPTTLAAILADTNELQTDDVPTLIAAIATALGDGTVVAGTVSDKNGYQLTDPAGYKKNTQAQLVFFMVDSSDHVSKKTGLTVTAQRSIDGAAFAACANAVTEISLGWYKITLAAADLNGDFIALMFTATGADDRPIAIKTET